MPVGKSGVKSGRGVSKRDKDVFHVVGHGHGGGQFWATCWRCGVEFDDSQFLYGAPCADCQLDVPGNWVRGRGKNGTLDSAERDALVTKLNGIGFTDPEIAEELGMRNRQQVWQVRKRLGLKPVYRPEKHMWKDAEAHRQHARDMVWARKSVGRGKSFYEVNDGQASREVLSDRADTGSADTNKSLP